MIILGIQMGHDPSVALIRDGALIALIEEEKLSRKKSEICFPTHALQYILTCYDIKPEEVEYVAFAGRVYNSKTRLELLARLTRNKWYRRLDYFRRIASYAGLVSVDISERNKDFFEKAVRVVHGFKNCVFAYYPHHLCHAAGAYYTCPFEADLIVTCDGRGEQDAFNFYTPGPEGDLILRHANTHRASVGQLYGVVTDLLGFRVNRHEGKVMGLAAFGRATELVDALKGLFFYQKDQLMRRPTLTDQTESLKLPLRRKIDHKTANDPDARDYNAGSAWLSAWVREKMEGRRKEDLAYAVQKTAETIVVGEIKRYIGPGGLQIPLKLALSGGVFANVRMNQKILELPEVANIFVQPAMSDAGLSLGAAVLAERAFCNPGAFFPLKNNYLGADFSASIRSFIQGLGASFSVVKMKNGPEDIADLLAENKIIGFYHGRMEYGPRALGNRSIIANTFRRAINGELNARLNRTEFMPFAPSVLDIAAAEYLENYRSDCPAADYMTITYTVKAQYRDVLQAVVHVDGTCRPHIVRRETNPYYYDVLQAFYQKTGCGAVINTSFNAHEEPIVATPQQALKALSENRIDVLIVEGYRITLPNTD